MIEQTFDFKNLSFLTVQWWSKLFFDLNMQPEFQIFKVIYLHFMVFLVTFDHYFATLFLFFRFAWA